MACSPLSPVSQAGPTVAPNMTPNPKTKTNRGKKKVESRTKRRRTHSFRRPRLPSFPAPDPQNVPLHGVALLAPFPQILSLPSRSGSLSRDLFYLDLASALVFQPWHGRFEGGGKTRTRAGPLKAFVNATPDITAE